MRFSITLRVLPERVREKRGRGSTRRSTWTFINAWRRRLAWTTMEMKGVAEPRDLSNYKPGQRAHMEVGKGIPGAYWCQELLHAFPMSGIPFLRGRPKEKPGLRALQTLMGLVGTFNFLTCGIFYYSLHPKRDSSARPGGRCRSETGSFGKPQPMENCKNALTKNLRRTIYYLSEVNKKRPT